MSEREKFRKYLEQAGAVDVLTKVMVELYEESNKPKDALEFIRKRLNASVPDLSEELAAAKARIAELEAENAALKEKVVQEPEK